MRQVMWIALASAGAIAAVEGCTASVAELCDFDVCLSPDSGVDAFIGDTGVDAHDARDTGGDSATVPCAPNAGPRTNPCVIDDRFAVFVAPTGDDNAQGTRALPFATVTRGIAAAKASSKSIVLVCSGTYRTPVDVNAEQDGVQVYGGLACPHAADAGAPGDAASDAASEASVDASGDGGLGDGGSTDGGDASAPEWTYIGAHAVVAPPVGAALTLTGLAKGIRIEDIDFVAPDADPTGGDSSIAVVIREDPTLVVFRRAAMIAGVPAVGLQGSIPTNYGGGPIAPAGNDALAATPGSGAAEKTCTCLNNDMSTGGRGGSGDQFFPSSGAPGLPSYDAAPPDNGIGGSIILNDCDNGHRGAPGANAAGGQGATAIGTVSALAFYGWSTAPGLGAKGGTGTVAQGGGGGGGEYFRDTVPKGGGGSGGCGGCGGAGGGGGGAGGSSIALVSITSEITLDACSLKANAGAPGGRGGAPQVPQQGGPGGAGFNTGCNGGAGGTGGMGGAGGGGAGGCSIAIAYTGTAPLEQNKTTKQVAEAGAPGGEPGSGGSPPATKGIDGIAVPTQSF